MTACDEIQATMAFVRIGEMISLRMLLDNDGRQTSPMILASMLDAIEMYHEKGEA
jgi:hypothetical protein